jgi:hypothetical protein
MALAKCGASEAGGGATREVRLPRGREAAAGRIERRGRSEEPPARCAGARLPALFPLSEGAAP